MKKWKLTTLAVFTACMLAANSSAAAYIEPAVGDPTIEPVKMRCTLYTDSGTTYSGSYTRPGIIAGKVEWQGMVAGLWTVDDDGSLGEFLGYYEVLDTGAGIDTDGDGVGDSIQNGQSIDIYCTDLQEVAAWQRENGDYIYIMLFNGKG